MSVNRKTASTRAAGAQAIKDRADGTKPRRGRPPGSRTKRIAEGGAGTIAVAGGVCPNPDCAAPCTDSQKHCAKCGTQLDANACPHCHARMTSADKFCGACGKARAVESGDRLTRLAQQPARLGVAPPPAPPAEEVKPPESVPTTPPAQPLAEVIPIRPRMVFRADALRVLVYNQVDKLLQRTGEPGLTEEEKKMLADDCAELLNFYVQLDPKYEVLARFAMSHIGVFVPKIVLVWARENRKAKQLAADGTEAKPTPIKSEEKAS